MLVKLSLLAGVLLREDMSNNKSSLIYPDDPDFSKWLAEPPPGWKNERSLIYAITPDSSIPKLVSTKELNELYYDAGLYGDGSELEGDELENFENDIEEIEDSILLYPPSVNSYVWQ